MAYRLKNRIVSMSLVATHRPNDPAFDHTFEHGVLPIRPSQRQSTAKSCCPRLRLFACDKHVMSPSHCHGEVTTSLCFGPIGCINPRCATECVDDDPRVIRQGRQTRRCCGGMCLDASVSNKGGFGFQGLRKPHFRGSDHCHPIRRQKRGDFFQFAGVVGRYQQSITGEFTHPWPRVAWQQARPRPFRQDRAAYSSVPGYMLRLLRSSVLRSAVSMLS